MIQSGSNVTLTRKQIKINVHANIALISLFLINGSKYAVNISNCTKDLCINNETVLYDKYDIWCPFWEDAVKGGIGRGCTIRWRTQFIKWNVMAITWIYLKFAMEYILYKFGHHCVWVTEHFSDHLTGPRTQREDIIKRVRPQVCPQLGLSDEGLYALSITL